VGGSVVKSRSRAFQTFADIQRVLAVAEATSIPVAALQTFADIARDTSAWRAGALTLRPNTLNLHRESPIRAERRNDATPTADICGHPRRPSTIAFAPKRTFASNALFFYDRSIRSAVTNA